jgi:hypothetical protein
MWADRILRIGVVVIALGLVFTLIAIIPLFAPDVVLPGALWFLAMLTGVGIAVAVLGLALQSRARRQRRRGST